MQIVADAYGHALYRRAIRGNARRVKACRSPKTTCSPSCKPPAGAAHAGARARRARDRQDVRSGRAALPRQHHRDRSRRVPGRAAAQGHGPLQRHRRLDGEGFGVQRDERAARGQRHRSGRLRPAHQRRRRRQHRRTVGRSGDLSRALFGDHAHAVAAGRRGDRRGLDSGQGARRRRRGREAVRGASSRHALRSAARGERARHRCTRRGIESIPVSTASTRRPHARYGVPVPAALRERRRARKARTRDEASLPLRLPT